jgi:hypothetical protein
LSFVIRSAGEATGEPNGTEGMFLESYNPEGNQGYGEFHWTKDVAKAKRYHHPADCLKDWNRVPDNHPIRSIDGKPNKPLTAFSILVERAPVRKDS